MKRIGESFGGVGGAQSDSAPPESNRICLAGGCPLPGSISDTTRGGGQWYCRFHFGVGSASERERITAEIRRKLRANEPMTSDEPTPTVEAMRKANARGLA